MKTSDILAAALLLSTVGGITAMMLHTESEAAGVHAVVLLDPSGTTNKQARCSAARLLTELALADRGSAREVSLWTAGARATGGEAVPVDTTARQRIVRPVEVRPDPAEAAKADDALAQFEAACQASPDTDTSPLYLALAAALDQLRPLGCGRDGVRCAVFFQTDGIETEDAVLIARTLKQGEPAARLDNDGIDVLMCGTAQRVRRGKAAPPPRADIEAAWRAEFTAPDHLAIYPACIPGMRLPAPRGGDPVTR